MRLSTRPLLLAALAFALPACDSYNNGYDDGYYDGLDDAPANDVSVVDFTIDGGDYTVSTDTRIASFESDDLSDSAERTALQNALATAGDGAIVVAYIDSGIVLDTETTGQTYSALPITRGQDAFVAFDVDNDGTVEAGEGLAYVDYTLSYEYSFDNEDFYFDVVSSARGDAFPGGATAFFDAVIPSDLDLRVVTIPADEFNKKPVDLMDYAAVQAAYNLPD